MPDSLRTPSAAVVQLNDIHTGLNPTSPAAICRLRSQAEAARVVRDTAAAGGHISIAGGRHAMGGQQFAAGATHIDTTGLNRVLDFDRDAGQIEVEAGMMWPRLIEVCRRLQPRNAEAWTIAQKQTGADRMTIGGSLSANAHGRGLDMQPLVADVESLTVIDPGGRAQRVSRACNGELFSLVVGGYGLFGLIYSARLRLKRRTTLERRVIIADADDLLDLFQERIDAGYVYGDFQFAIDAASDTFLQRGILSCYRPVEPRLALPEGQRVLGEDEWLSLLHLAHTDKSAAFEGYVRHYLATDKQLYHSDTSQLAVYLDDYHARLEARTGCAQRGTEVISELFVPRIELPALLREAATIFRKTSADLIYGTVRLIRREAETFLAWARDDFACIVFNLHTPHTGAGVAGTSSACRKLIDAAIARRGSFYLTYHRFARHDQVVSCYPQFPEFLAMKQRHDAACIFDSDWHRHYRQMLKA